MKIKFNHFERVAGVFVLAAIAGSVIATIGVGIKRGWFSRKIPVTTHLKSADGIYVGTQVQVSGLRAGEVDEVELLSNSDIRIRLLVKEEFFRRLKIDSKLQVIRPFVIGEKVIDLSTGSETAGPLAPGAHLEVLPSFDVMELLSGRTLGNQLQVFGKLADNIRVLAEAFADPERTKALIQVIDETQPLVRNMNEMSKQVVVLTKKLNRSDDLEKILAQTRVLTVELNKILPEVNKQSPTLGKDMAAMATNLSVLTNEFAKLVPMMQQMAPHVPKASTRALEALDETVVTLKAIQKSFLLRGAAREVREEEAKKRQQEEATDVRAPSSDD
jgi:phospholipid/cholesterol/gamma-HCH transport system substrate-binding protein